MFEDRVDAGKKLGEALDDHEGEDLVIFGLPRGGVVVASEVAKVLKAPLDIIVVRKLGVPYHHELGFGAIAPNGIEVLNDEIIKYAGISKQEMENVETEEEEEMERRIRTYRGNTKMPELKGKTAVIVDDGVATGITAQAAIKYIKTLNPSRIIFAAPVGAFDSLKRIEREVDELVCLETPSYFNSVGEWYRQFDQTTDEEVIRILKK